MREYKFRGKRIDNGNWGIGSLCIRPNGSYDISMPDEDFGSWWWEVDPKTVGQYVGLKERRKDSKESKELYEGDVVRCYGGEYCQGYYEFDQKIVIKDMIFDCFMMGENEHIELLGNIHDNPELREVMKKYNHRSGNFIKTCFENGLDTGFQGS